MKKLEWFQRQFNFGIQPGMLPFILERLEGTIVRIEAKVKNIPEEILSARINDKWSIKQNLAHLAEVDEIAIKRIDEIRKGISPMSPAVFEPAKDYNAQPVREVIDYFIANRTDNLNLFRNLRDDDAEKYSEHPRLKVKMNPVDLAYFHAEHDDHHLVRITEILEHFKINTYANSNLARDL
jgi:uncharacterized damage-inducible protein DinB